MPDRHPQGDLFICDVADAVLKDIMPQMEHPFYSLSKKPEMNVRRYEHNGNWLEIIPSYKGLATIYDKDILIYAISQIMSKLNNGEKVSKRVRINSRELLIFTNRGTSGREYLALSDALERLRGTTIKTNIVTGDEEQTDIFGLIDAASIKRKHGLDGRLLWCEIVLSDWVFNAIEAKEVLTLNRNYFRLRKPIERRIYEVARKHCGQKEAWSIGIDLLHKKSGSQGNVRLFKQAIKHLSENDHLPDYSVALLDDKVVFHNRGHIKNRMANKQGELPSLPPHILEQAKKIAPRYDVYALEADWRTWWASSGKKMPEKPYAAFLGFCKQRNEKHPIY